MFTWVQMLIAVLATMLLTGFLSILVISLMVASGNKEREDEAYKIGFQEGKKSVMENNLQK